MTFSSKLKLERRFMQGLEFRQAEAGEGEGSSSLASVSGYLVKYDDVAEFERGYSEKIQEKAFQLEDRIHLDVQHSQSKLLSSYPNLMSFEERDDGLYMAAQIVDTQEGRDAIRLMDAGVLIGFSSEFYTLSDYYEERQRIITSAKLFGVGLVSYPAYTESQAMMRSRVAAHENFMKLQQEQEQRDQPTARRSFMFLG